MYDGASAYIVHIFRDLLQENGYYSDGLTCIISWFKPDGELVGNCEREIYRSYLELECADDINDTKERLIMDAKEA
jgi:hypothetical protein